MDARLIPDGFDKRLEHLIEECAEVILAAQKLKRFGTDAEFDGVKYDNVETLRLEMIDLEAAMLRLRTCNLGLRP